MTSSDPIRLHTVVLLVSAWLTAQSERLSGAAVQRLTFALIRCGNIPNKLPAVSMLPSNHSTRKQALFLSSVLE